MDNNVYKETRHILRRCTPEIVLKFIIATLYRGSLLIVPIFWGKVIDKVTSNDFNTAYKMVLFTLGVTLLYYIISCLNQFFYYKLYKKMYNLYSKLAYESFIKNSIYSLSRFKLSEFNNIVNNDIDIIVAFFSDSIIKIVRILEFLIIYYYFYTINFNMFLVTVIISILMVFVLLFSNRTTRKLNIKRKQALDKKTAISHEVFNTVKEIKGFYVFKSINERIKDKAKDYLNAHSSYTAYTVIVKQGVLGIIEIVRYLLAIYGIYLFSVGQMEIGTILVIYSYYGKITENYDIIGGLATGVEDAKVSLKRLNKLIEYRRTDGVDDYVRKSKYLGMITFKNVLYGNKKDPILKWVSFVIKANSFNVITGPTGSGKTGVVDLLMKLNRKHHGNILIDDVPYEKIDDDTYYNLVSLVRKEPSFFELSIKDNLMLVGRDFKKVREVCKRIGIDDEIASLKKGYDTEINSKNEKISINLRRGLAIARVILKDSKVLMFDEILDTLEGDLQRRVLLVLEGLKTSHTIIIISREKQIIMMADRVIEMDDNIVRSLKSNWLTKKTIL